MQDTFPIRARNDTNHDTPAPTLLIPIIHLITRIYLAYRLCTNHVCPPFAFRITVSIKVVPCLCHHRSSTITFTCEPFDKPKVLYHQVTFPTPWVLSIAPCISCTIRIVVFVLFVPIPPTLPRIFILFRHRSSFLFFIVLWVVLVALSGNNASPFWDCCFNQDGGPQSHYISGASCERHRVRNDGPE